MMKNIPSETTDGIPTLNKMGFMAPSLDFYSGKFISYASTCTKPILEIGCAYGLASLKALSLGATVVSNDLDVHHLRVLEENCPEEHRKRLTTKVGNFNELKFTEDYFNAILIARVIHFMDGVTIRETLSRCFNTLAPQGKLFIVSDTPYLKESLNFIPIFENKLESGEEWPGLVKNINSIGSPSVDSLPEMFHFLDISVLERELKLAGFFIEEISYFSRDDYSENSRLDGREGIGAVAVKL